MEHTVFAVFHDLNAAEGAVQSLLASELCKEHHVGVVVHRDVDPARLDSLVQYEEGASATDGARAAVRGAVIGGILGAAIAGPFGMIGAGPLTAALFGGWMGAAQGAFAGGLIGLGLTDRALQQLAARIQRGDTLVSIHADNKEREALVEQFLEQHRAHVMEKHLA